MKYTVTAVIDEDNQREVEVKVRSDAGMRTLFRKCMNKVGAVLLRDGFIQSNTEYQFDPPNVWRNGAVGAAWFCEPFINVTIQSENGCWIAL